MNSKTVFLMLLAATFAACSGGAVEPVADTPAQVSDKWTETQRDGWLYLIEELEVQELFAALSAEHAPRDCFIENVNVITMTSDKPLLAQTVTIAGGQIAGISPTAVTTRPADACAHDGSGHWLIPGLADMHTHNLDSHSQHLLNLAMGITTVREMAGFPFLLAMRDAIRRDNLLAPTMYLSGTILNGSDFGGYALALNSAQGARAAVRQQVADGYDFIKTHNSLSEEVYLAIAAEAQIQGLDLVGHIPVDVSVRMAVDAGMRTFEHFKGYIKDDTLTLSDEDYVAATRGAQVWNTPTFVNYRNQLRGNEAAELLANTAEMQYVAPTVLKRWKKYAGQEIDQVTELRQNIYPMSRQIFAELRKLSEAQFLAGTDAGAYELMPPGFVLLEEVQIFQDLGMTPYEALQTATVNAAVAMRREGQFGVIAPGASADLVLLTENPLEDVANLHKIEAIGLRGIWLDKAARDDLLARLRKVYAKSLARMAKPSVSGADLDDFLARLQSLNKSGFVFRDHYLDFASSMFTYLGRDADAKAITAMKTEAGFGFSFFKFR